MAKTSTRQKRTIGRIMHEYGHGELKSGPEGKGGLVTNRRQAIAIALNDAGPPNMKVRRKTNVISPARSGRKPRAPPPSKRRKANRVLEQPTSAESTPAMGGENARGPARHRGLAAGRPQILDGP